MKPEEAGQILDMLSTIDINSSVAVYVQIENHVQFAISSGRLQATDQLPSVRELSERLQVNPNTVAKAYRDLEVMGLLYTRRGMGVFVNKGVEVKCREDVRKRIIGRLHEVVAEAKASGMNKSEVLEVVDKSINSDAQPYGETPPRGDGPGQGRCEETRQVSVSHRGHVI
ncbi:GntR family transcriptional regulator [Roseovarius pacificus]|uniref:GntR family transcriptional regulator n=1 Tax=Roseovarius pacificus TaxID=337701 RepID=UPI002A18DF84|nr:GntR family transcriptional regulator [Roseovarius pacificus]